MKLKNTLKSILGLFIMILPFAAFFGTGIYAQLTRYSDDVLLSEYKCATTFTEEHWHKYSPPTTHTYSVVHNNHVAYVIEGDCTTGISRKTMWEQEHVILSMIGLVTQVALLIIFIVAILVAVVFVVVTGLNLIDSGSSKPKS